MRDWRRRGAPGIAPTTPPARGPPQVARKSRLRVAADTSNFARAKRALQRAAHLAQFAHFAYSRLLL
jgi:hypothetical protein